MVLTLLRFFGEYTLDSSMPGVLSGWQESEKTFALMLLLRMSLVVSLGYLSPLFLRMISFGLTLNSLMSFICFIKCSGKYFCSSLL